MKQPGKSSNTTKSTGSNQQPEKKSSSSTAKPSEQKGLAKEFRDQFLKKLQICSTQYDFKDDTKNPKEKSERLQYLTELTELLNQPNYFQSLIIPHLDLVIEMIQKNIFKPLPVLQKAIVPNEVGMEDNDEPLLDPSWPHLQPVYEFFLQLIVNDATDVKSLKVFITHNFIQEFLELFDSEEPRERDYLKNILHRLYAKLVPRRKMIRKAITDCFHTLIHENYKFNGSSELLDIMASIISGFAIPLRDEHVVFFKSVIIPLHKVQTSFFYFDQLLRCSMLFLSKDPQLAIFLVEGLLRYWPTANSSKEIQFLSELQEVLEVCEISKLESLVNKLFRRLIKCIAGPHLQVADRAMCFFEHDYFLTILKQYKQTAFPILVPVISQIADTHWHKVLQESLNTLKTILKEIDYTTFEKSLQNKNNGVMYLVQDQKQLKKERQKTEERWKQLCKVAQSKYPTLKEPVIPYQDSLIVGEHNGLDGGNIIIM